MTDNLPTTDMALYEFIFERKWVKKYTWQQISDVLQYGLNTKAMQKNYKRLSVKMKQPYKPEPIAIVEPVVKKKKKSPSIPIVKPIDDTIVPSIDKFYQFNEVSWEDKEAYIDKVIEWMYKYTAEWFHWKPTPEYLREMIDELLYGDKIVLLEPRFHGKTNTMVCLFAYWMIELRKTVMVIVQGTDHQTNIHNMIVSIFESAVVIEDYGELIAKKAGRPNYTINLIPKYQHGISFAFFKAASVAGGYVGLHPDWTHLDDIVQKKIRNDNTFKAFMEDFDGNVLDLSPDKTTISGTRKELGDFYDMAFERGFLPLHKKAIEFLKGVYPTMDDVIYKKRKYRGKTIIQVESIKQNYLDKIEVKTLNCPNYTLDKILARYLTNKNSFFSQMQNEPVPLAGNIFKPHWLKTIPKMEIRPNNKTNVVDPAFGKSYTSSDTAMIICMMYEGKLLIADIITGKFPNDELVDELERVKEVHKLRGTWMENDYTQITMRYNRDHRIFKIGLDFYTNKKYGDKIARIQQLSDAFRFEQIIFMEGCTHYDLFEAQYLRFDGNPKGKWDILDAMASAYRLMYEGEEEEYEDDEWSVIGGSDGYI